MPYIRLCVCVCVFACVCAKCYQFLCRCTSMWEYVTILPFVHMCEHSFVSKSIWEFKYKWIFVCIASHMDVWTVLNTHGVHSYYDCVSVFFKYICVFMSGYVYRNEWHTCLCACEYAHRHTCSVVCLCVYYNVCIWIHCLIDKQVHNCVFMYMRTPTHKCVCKCLCGHIWVYVCIHLGSHLCWSCLFTVSLCVRVCLSVDMWKYAWMYVYLCLWVNVCHSWALCHVNVRDACTPIWRVNGCADVGPSAVWVCIAMSVPVHRVSVGICACAGLMVCMWEREKDLALGLCRWV